MSPQYILNIVATNIVVDKITDQAKTLSVCLLPHYGHNIKQFFQCVTTAWTLTRAALSVFLSTKANWPSRLRHYCQKHNRLPLEEKVIEILLIAPGNLQVSSYFFFLDRSWEMGGINGRDQIQNDHKSHEALAFWWVLPQVVPIKSSFPGSFFTLTKKKREKGLCYDFNSLTEIPRFLSDEECEHIISLAKESGLVMSIAGFDVAAYEGDLDEDMREAGKTAFFFYW